MLVSLGLLMIGVAFLLASVKVVAEKEAKIVQRFGKYHRTLLPGLQFIVPVMDSIAFKVSLRETVDNVPPQVCITKDNVQVTIDGVLYYQVTDPRAAVYGASSFKDALHNIAQTTLRSEVGKQSLDALFEARTVLNNAVVEAVDEAAKTWGVKVLRYELMDISPPGDVLDSMKKQVNAERERRAQVASAEGHKQAAIARSEGEKRAAVNTAEGAKEAMILAAQAKAEAMNLNATAHANAVEVEARAQANAAVMQAKAQADALSLVAEALKAGGMDAANLKLADQYIEAFGKLAKESNTLVIPADLTGVAGFVATAKTTLSALAGGSAAVQDKPKTTG